MRRLLSLGALVAFGVTAGAAPAASAITCYQTVVIAGSEITGVRICPTDDGSR